MTLNHLKTAWQAEWPSALAGWSPYIKLGEPTWCCTTEEEKEAGLTGSFAMIRLVDHRVVVSLRQVEKLKLQDFAKEILAHEIGHHVYCPADLNDNARMMVRLRYGLPTKEHLAPFIGNLYADLLINDRLQRSAKLSMAAVYKILMNPPSDRLWNLYMRTYELLWRLDDGTLTGQHVDSRINTDAQLCMRLVRNYSNDWLGGAGRFASLYLPYLLEAGEAAQARNQHEPWNDTQDAGKGGVPTGISEIDPEETTGALHPSLDPSLSGIPSDTTPTATPNDDALDTGKGETGQKSLRNYRGPVEYANVLKAAGADVPETILIARYYKELAVPHLIRFPVRELAPSTEPVPEGLDTWDADSPIANIDWMGTLTTSPIVIPGFTTRERLYGSSPGSNPEPEPLDLYLGVDCSGSMGNPANTLSYPILAATVIALSALRARANVMVALSGEPGKTVTTPGFIRDEQKILTTLTGYLGTGTTFGIHRLDETFTKPLPATPIGKRPVHILIITDTDIFMLLAATNEGRLGWDVARDAVNTARGGATYVLQIASYQANAKTAIDAREKRMLDDGWRVAHVNSMDGLLRFAREFSQAKYERRPHTHAN